MHWSCREGERKWRREGFGEVGCEAVRVEREKRIRVGRRSILAEQVCCGSQVYVKSRWILVVSGCLAEEIRGKSHDGEFWH
jgi:hypothetical protein